MIDKIKYKKNYNEVLQKSSVLTCEFETENLSAKTLRKPLECISSGQLKSFD